MDDNMLVQQNKVLIALLARSTIGLEYIENIVRSGKKKGNPNDFVRAYNALDGTRTVTEIAQMVGGTRQNMSQVLQNWEDKGIVYNVGTSSQPVYFGLLKLSLRVQPRTPSEGGLKSVRARGIQPMTNDSANIEEEYRSESTTETSEVISDEEKLGQ